jgi:hypothetical protein|nr:MAG TPA: hypothetical protein [Caudoviricetes sp.]
MEIINIETLEDLHKFLLVKHKLPDETTLEELVNVELLYNEYSIYSFQDKGNISISYNTKPTDLTHTVRKVLHITCGNGTISIEESSWDDDREQYSTLIRHDYQPFDLLIMFKGSSTFLYISLAAESEVVTTLKRCANNVITHFDF